MPPFLLHLPDGRRVQVTVASTWGARLAGLLGRDRLAADTGLLLRPCAAIHTCGMAFTIDAVFCAANGTVLAVRTLAPWRLARAPRGTGQVLELAAGAAAGLTPGQRLALPG